MDARLSRRALQNRLFPHGIPRLWCPMIVHYTSDHRIDAQRMEEHLKSIVDNVKSFLIFGSTGDGWELKNDEKHVMIRLYSKWSQKYGIRMLLGVLQPKIGESLREMREWIRWMKEETALQDSLQAMEALGVCGFTVCAPKGADLSQDVICSELSALLDENVPMALYQLPQITENEISPETVQFLAEKYPNFFLFKDTSGTDNVLKRALDYSGVFFVRGAEGEYYKWYGTEKLYNGFLLSSANCFGKQLSSMITEIDNRNQEKAREYSDLVDNSIAAVFRYTSALEGGNVFANANKCIDHCLAYGKHWKEKTPPMRHCAEPIPEQYIEYAAKILDDYSLLSEKGYIL